MAGALLVACSGGNGNPGSGKLSTWATFPDIGSLIAGAPIDMADVQVGQVTHIGLDGDQARVDMSVDRSAQVPADVTAEVRVTAILGQDFVEMVPGRAATVARRGGKPVALLAGGERIRHATVVPGIQQLVQYGAQVFGAIDSTRLAGLVATGAQGFGGQGASIRNLINGFATTAQGYAGQSQTITNLVQEMNTLSSSIAPYSGPDAQAIGNLASTTGVLTQESVSFDNLLQALDGLAVSNRQILDTYVPDISSFFGTLDALSKALVARLSDLGGIIRWLPAHNAALASAVAGGYVQILDDLILCGVPNGGSDQTPAFTCGGAQ